MKILKFFTVLLLYLSSFQVVFATPELKPETETIKAQVTDILKEEFKNDQLLKEEPIKIIFMITNSNEIIVLKTNSSVPALDQRIKSALNYNHLNADQIKAGTYNLDLVLKPEN